MYLFLHLNLYLVLFQTVFISVFSIIFQPVFASNIGLSNHGSTCYINSLVQLMYAATEFRELVKLPLSDDKKKKPENYVREALAMLFRSMEERTIDVDTAMQVFIASVPNWYAFRQHDVEEFLRKIHDYLETELSAVFGCEYAKLYISKDHLGNDIVYRTSPVEYIDFITIPQSVSLETSLEMYSNRSDVVDDGVDVQTVDMVLKYSKYVLFIIHRDYSFPVEMSIPENFLVGQARFELRGVIIHTGTRDSGHYTSYTRTETRVETRTDTSAETRGDSEDARWYFASDSHVAETSIHNVLADSKMNARILMYKIVSEHVVLQQNSGGEEVVGHNYHNYSYNPNNIVYREEDTFEQEDIIKLEDDVVDENINMDIFEQEDIIQLDNTFEIKEDIVEDVDELEDVVEDTFVEDGDDEEVEEDEGLDDKTVETPPFIEEKSPDPVDNNTPPPTPTYKPKPPKNCGARYIFHRYTLMIACIFLLTLFRQ